jgi:hypothetical protein
MSDIRTQDKAEYRRFLDDIGEDYCKPGCYCLLKEVLMSIHPSKRTLIQLKIIDRIKLERSHKEGKDIGWEGALKVWVEEGLAKKFAEVYSDEKNAKTIYKEMFS